MATMTADNETQDTSVPSHHGIMFDHDISKLSKEPFEVEKEPKQTIKDALKLWVRECVWPGLGLFGESYLLFSIGTLWPLWELLFDDCFSFETCSPRLLKSLTLSVVLGVICGMMLLGTLANTLGRRTGSILTASLMTLGAWGMTLVSLVLVSNAPRLFQSLAVLLFLFGVGVGGEYPLSASSASERAMAELEENRKREDSIQQQRFSELGLDLYEEELLIRPTKRQYRGRRVQLVFTMQGVGILINCLVMTLLLLVLGQTGSKGNVEGTHSISGWYNLSVLVAIWRITYALGAAVLSYVLVSRILYLQESTVWQEDMEQQQKYKLMKQMEYTSPTIEKIEPNSSQDSNVSQVSSLSIPSVVPQNDDTSIPSIPSTTSEEDLKSSELYLLLRNYGWRLFGSSMSWLLWDVAFYGNKLFQASFLLALTGDETTLIEMSIAATLNAAVALCGYFCAAALIDVIGRVALQQYGFIITGMLFVACGFLYDTLPPTVLVCMYFLSSFFGQCGPNSTTFIVPAEIFPTKMRTMCHGIAAASGKAGALLAAVVFSRIQDMENLFLWSGYVSFTAAVITFWFIPEVSQLNLYETDRRWHMILQGRKADYVGEATMPKFLSFFERKKMGLNT